MAKKHSAEELVTAGQIAEMFDVHASAVTNWQNRYEDYPKPWFQYRKVRLYVRADIVRWVEKRTAYKRWSVEDLRHQAAKLLEKADRKERREVGQ